MHASNSVILRGDLRAQLVSLAQVAHALPARTSEEEAYRYGLRAALLSIATAYALNVPEIRELDADARCRHAQPTPYDMRL
jgi:hypothetical protein